MPHTNEQIAHDFAIAIAAQNYTKSSVRNVVMHWMIMIKFITKC